jgi:putative molybdopterin biosynthesis protein
MFRELMTFDLAKKVIFDKINPKPLGEEKIPLLEAHSRILSEDIITKLNIPPFNRSTVDGYALKAEDTFGAEENNPTNLNITGEISVGVYPKIQLRKGEAAEIVTGAPIPLGANAVVMVENTQKQKNRLLIYRAVTQDENVMKKGTDIKKGETVLKAGKILEASDIGVLAAIGLKYVKVLKIPNVAVISTGAEIMEPGKNLVPGKIYDINAYSLSAAILNSGGKPIYLGVIPDDEVALEKALNQALLSSDIIITSGGVSVGPRDYTPKIVNSLGKPGVIISGIAVKPGKPTTVAVIGTKPVFSLPGHPTSALLIFYLLVSPIIQRIAGRKLISGKTVQAILTSRLFSAKGRKTFVTVKLYRDKNQKLIADPTRAGVSGAITTLSKADGFIEIPADQQFIDSNEEVMVTLFTNKKV